MKKNVLILVIILLAFTHGQSQESQDGSNTLESQFSDAIDKSNNYQDYKVVKKYKLNQLRKNVIDSISALDTKIDGLYEEIEGHKTEISGLKSKLTETETALSESMAKEDGISLFGLLLKKSTYNTILWSVIGLLLLALLVFVSKYRSSNRVTRESMKKLAETETEFEGFRQRSLEREQQIRRKLQDELNKNKNA